MNNTEATEIQAVTQQIDETNTDACRVELLARAELSYQIFTRALELTTALVDKPLHELSHIWWTDLKLALSPDIYDRISEVYADDMLFDTAGLAYYIPDAADQETYNNLVANNLVTRNELEVKSDTWLREHAVRMKRVTTAPEFIPFDSGIWGVASSSTASKYVYNKMVMCVHAVLTEIVSALPDTDQVLVVRPELRFTNVTDDPFRGVIHCSGWCGFYTRKPLMVK